MNKAKLTLSIIGILLLCVLAAGLLMQAFMPDGKKPADWFNKPVASSDKKPNDDQKPTDNNVVEEAKPETKPDDTPLDGNNVVATPAFIDLKDVNVMTLYANTHPEECYMVSANTAIIRGQMYYIHNDQYFPCDIKTVHFSIDLSEGNDDGYSYKFSPEEATALMRTTDEVIPVMYTGEYYCGFVTERRVNLYFMQDLNLFSPCIGWSDTSFGECNMAIVFEFEDFGMYFLSMLPCKVEFDVSYYQFYGVVEEFNQGLCDAISGEFDRLNSLEAYQLPFEDEDYEILSSGWKVQTIECEAGQQEELLSEMFNGYDKALYIGTDNYGYETTVFDVEDTAGEGGVKHYLSNDSFYKYLEFNEISVYDISELDVTSEHSTFLVFVWEEGTENLYAYVTEADTLTVVYDGRN